MLYQISSGQGPAECELGVAKFLAYLQRRHQVTVEELSAGYHAETYRSVRLRSDEDLQAYVGSIQWICRSPYRPAHKRKNWFIDFSRLDEVATQSAFDPERIVYESFRCSGKGGQNVNKVSSGVRAVYRPSGQVVECTEERSQHLNKLKAAARLQQLWEQSGRAQQAAVKNSHWRRHTSLQRGNAQKIFHGINFE